MKKTAIIALILFATPALAQQQTTEDQLYNTCSNISLQLAKQLDAANAQIADMKKQLDAKASDQKQK